MIKAILFMLGIIFMCLGIIGLMLPVIPQIPFLLLGVFFLSCASKRFKRMLVNSKIYIKYLKEFVDKHEKIKKFFES